MDTQKILILIGLVFLAVGILWPFLVKIPFGRLPGDIIINRPGLKIFIPITTMIIISIIISLIAYFSKK